MACKLEKALGEFKDASAVYTIASRALDRTANIELVLGFGAGGANISVSRIEEDCGDFLSRRIFNICDRELWTISDIDALHKWAHELMDEDG